MNASESGAGRVCGRSFRAVLVAVVATLSSCVTIGKDFSVEPVTSLRPGAQTQDDVRRMFGDPWRTGLEDGSVTWTYACYRYFLFGDTEARDLVVRFTSDGHVRSYTFNSTRPEDADTSRVPAPF